MINLSIILTTFLLVFLAELGDKTQLVAFSMTASTKRPFIIFFSTSFALIFSSVLSALIGGISSKFLPQITSFLAPILFIIFGIVLLFTKEEKPLIKNCFLKAIALENYIHMILPKIFKKHNCYDYEIINIIRQEKSHANIFEILLKQKTLFNDEINSSNELKELEKLLKSLKIKWNLIKSPFNIALNEIIKLENKILSVYLFILNYLKNKKNKQPDLIKILEVLIEEERNHIKIFNKFLEREKNG